MIIHEALQMKRLGLVWSAISVVLTASSIGALAHTYSSPAAERRAFAERILASTTVEWRWYFALYGRKYTIPKSMFLQLPGGHPARGFGYFRSLGVYVELSDMIDLQREQPASADMLTALMIAHEVAHHAQSEIEKAKKIHSRANVNRELEADCAAGWWLGQANARNLKVKGKPLFVARNLLITLPLALNLLSGSEPRSRGSEVNTHGRDEDRVSAIELGMRLKIPDNCGPGLKL